MPHQSIEIEFTSAFRDMIIEHGWGGSPELLKRTLLPEVNARADQQHRPVRMWFERTPVASGHGLVRKRIYLGGKLQDGKVTFDRVQSEPPAMD